MVASTDGRFDRIHSHLVHQVPHGLQKITNPTVLRQGVVLVLARLFLELQHRQQHQRDSLSVREVVLGPDAVCESVHVACQLGIDGISAVHSCFAHSQPGLVVIGFAQHDRQVVQDQFDAFHGHTHVFFTHIHIAHRTFDTMAECIDTARHRHRLRRMDREFAIVHHVCYVQANEHRRTLGPLFVSHHRAYRQFGTRSGRRRHHDERQGLTGYRQELKQQRFDRQMRHTYTGGNHLTTVHDRPAA